MFPELRHNIIQLTANRKFPTPHKVSRTFYFLVSPSMSYCKEWFQQWFPILDDEIAHLYPWILMEQEDVFQADVEMAVKNAFDAKRINEITMGGISILDSVNQIFVIADLCEKDSFNKIKLGCDIIKRVFNKILTPESPLYWTGIFILRRISSNKHCTEDKPVDKKLEITKMLCADKNTIEKISRELSQTLFHRLFWLDVSNPQGTLLADVKDHDCLIGHLLYSLTTYPIRVESPDRYTEWLLRGGDERTISSFSAFSLVLPIDQILETITFMKGTEVMQESLLTEHSPDQDLFYFNNFLQKNSLLQLDEVKKSFSENSDYTLRNPVPYFPDFLSMRPEDYLETMSTMDASLLGIAKDNEAIMYKIGEKRLREWKESLEDHFESILTNEIGGLLIAKKFLKKLKNHFEGIIPQKSGSTTYGDSVPIISTIRRLLNKGPRKEAIWGRALALATVSVVALAFFPLLFLVKVLLLIGLPLLSIILAAFSSHSFNQQLQNQILKLEEALRKKWNILLDNGKSEVAKKYLEELNKFVEHFDGEVELTLKRVMEIVDYFKNQYIPPFPEEFASWKYVVKERERLIQHENLCKLDLPKVERDYLEIDRPLFLWRRLSSPGVSEPNPWEQHMVERAAVRLLPFCGDIINLNILSLLQEEKEKFEGYKMAMVRGAQPFLNLRPGSENAELTAILETEVIERQPVVEELINALSGYFHNIQQIGTHSPYRISFFGFLEGANADDILLR